MAITKAKKVSILDKLTKIAGSQAAAFVNFHGLSVAKMTELRKRLRNEQVGLFVAKKTLIKKAITDTSVPGVLPELDGEVAVAYTEGEGADPLAPARGLYSFTKDNKDSLKILGGIFDGHLANADLVLALATIPSREILHGQLVNLLASPLRSLAIAVDQIALARAKS